MHSRIPADIVLKSPTGRVTLRPPTEEYDEIFAETRSDPILRLHLPFFPEKISPQEVKVRRGKRDVDDSLFDWYAFLDEGEGETWFGACGLYHIDDLNDTCEVGILLAPAFHRRGLATEILFTLMDFAFENDRLHMHKVTYETSVSNACMRTWLEKVAGVTMEYTIREKWKTREGAWIDTANYGITASDWGGGIKQKLLDRLRRC